MQDAPPSPAGPRSSAVHLGLESAKHSSNILRLLESSHGATSHYNTTIDTMSTVWHPEGLSWRFQEQEWQGVSPMEQATNNNTTSINQEQPPMNYASATPKLLSTSFSDDRTALVKLQGSDGRLRYISLLRLDPPDPTDGRHHHHHPHNQASNDGWIIVREVLVPDTSEKATDTNSNDDIWTSLQIILHKYLEIEHGGGAEDFQSASSLFHSQSSLLAVGISEPDDDEASLWTAPAGRILEISRDTYLEGVKSQSPHAPEARQFDQICSMDIISSVDPSIAFPNKNAPAAAVATVRVGNGAQTMIFEDHLLLGYGGSSGSWKILSKIFSPQAWPK